MVVGEDIAVLTDDHAGAGALCDILTVEGAGLHTLGRDLDDRIGNFFCDLSSGLVCQHGAGVGLDLGIDLMDHHRVGGSAVILRFIQLLRQHTAAEAGCAGDQQAQQHNQYRASL